MGGHQIQAAHQKLLVHNAAEQRIHGLQNVPGGGGKPAQVFRAVGVLGNFAAVMVGHNRALIGFAAHRIGQVFNVVAHGKHQLVGHKALIHQLQRQFVGHFAHHKPGFFGGVGRGKHLPFAHAGRARLIALDLGNGAGLITPRMVDQQLGVYAEQLKQKLLVIIILRTPHGTAGNIAHGVQPGPVQLFGIARAHTPKIRERCVIPQFFTVAALGKLGHAHALCIGGHVLGHDIHGHLAQIQVGANACGGGDAGFGQHGADQLHGKVVCAQTVQLHIRPGIDEHLINGIYMDILGRDITQIGLINAGAHLDIMRHAGRGGNVAQRLVGACRKGGGILRFARKLMPAGPAALGIDLIHTLHHLKQAGAAGNAIAF